MIQRESRHAGTWRPMGDGSRREPSHAHHTTSSAQVQELRAAATGKVVAVLDGDVLRKTVAASLHFLRKPPSIAFDCSILDAARQAGVRRIEVLDRETDRTYTASLGDFERWGVSVNRGFGAQRALPLERWQVRRPGDGVQLALFGGTT